ncbi:hypothetical protein A2U01_0089990, partial [Trifolium medium]|nr:hypothetical protein [Trifolium medium]
MSSKTQSALQQEYNEIPLVTKEWK